MAKLTLTKAFQHFGASPVNARWACSAIASDNSSFVMSGWDHILKPYANGRLCYEARLSSWKSRNGRSLFRRHLEQALAHNLPVRLILATSSDIASVQAGEACRTRKTFSVQDDLVGRVISFDGDHFIIEFQKN